MEIKFNDINVNIVVEKKRNRNMYFRFKDVNTLYVTCPYLTSDKTIIKFIEKNYDSLSKMHKKTIKNEESDEYFCFKGERYIRVVFFVDAFLVVFLVVFLATFLTGTSSLTSSLTSSTLVSVSL